MHEGVKQVFCGRDCVIYRNEELANKLKAYFGEHTTDAHLKMAEAPAGTPFLQTYQIVSEMHYIVHIACSMCHDENYGWGKLCRPWGINL